MAESAFSPPPESPRGASAPAGARPRSAVSAGVGTVGLVGLVSYLLIARFTPDIAAFLGIAWGLRGPMNRPNLAIAEVLAFVVPMVLPWGLTDQGHRTPATRLARGHGPP